MSMPRKIPCTVEAITDHGGRVYTLDLALSTPAPVFRPGQFLHLAVDAYDPGSFWPESRVFSIASSPKERRKLCICYSVKGRYTTRMEQALKPGCEVWIKLPYGEFVIDGDTAPVLLAGGTGISAFTGFLQALEPEHSTPVTLIYGARSPQLLLFREMILSQFERVPRMQVLFFTEDSSPQVAEGQGARSRTVSSFPGLLSLDVIWPRLLNPLSRAFYLSGPPVMIQKMSAGLQERGVPPTQIRTDAWE